MQINKNLLTELNNYKVENGERLLWIALRLEQPDPDGFFLLQIEDWSEKYSIPKSTIKRYLMTLEDKGLIRREQRPLSPYGPYPVKGGKYLFVQVLEPESRDNMTFFARFLQIDTQILSGERVSRIASFRDVYNVANTIRLRYAFCELEENDPNSIALNRIEKGDLVVFKAKVKSREDKTYLSTIWNIRPTEEYYDRGN